MNSSSSRLLRSTWLQQSRRRRLQPLVSERRHQSSSAAQAAFDDEDYDSSDSLAPSASSLPSSALSQRSRQPRLEALREQLRVEKQSPGLHIPSSPNNQNGSDSMVLQTPQPSLSTGTGPQQPTDPVALRDWLDSLPLPSSEQTLLDTYGRFHNYLRISLAERCNLRCTYCMPPEGVPLSDHLLSTDQILHLASHFVARGVTKFRLTGGEPTLRSDLVPLVEGLEALSPSQIGLTTNGVILTRHLPALVDAGLTSLNISLDTLDPTKFEQLTRRPYFTRVWQALEMANEMAASNNLTVKLNCVVMRNVNDAEVSDFIQLTKQLPNVQVRFIEYMPFSDNGWDWSKCVPYQELLTDDLVAIGSDDPSDTTKWYRSIETGAKIGFITSMSQHFCATCNRVRLTADGQLKVCLFDGREVHLKRVLELPDSSAEDLDKIIYHALQHKQEKLGGHPDPASIRVDRNRPMTLIGG